MGELWERKRQILARLRKMTREWFEFDAMDKKAKIEAERLLREIENGKKGDQ